jgi:hypothetical protein
MPVYFNMSSTYTIDDAGVGDCNDDRVGRQLITTTICDTELEIYAQDTASYLWS